MDVRNLLLCVFNCCVVSEIDRTTNVADLCLILRFVNFVLVRPSFRHNIPYYPPPGRAASYTVAEKLSELLKLGMEWSLPCQRESAQYK